MIDYKNLSKEQLITLLMFKDNIIKMQVEQIGDLEAEKRAQNLEIENLIQKYEVKKEQNQIMRAERFGKKSEKNIVINEAEKEIENEEKNKKVKPRKTPTEQFIIDLKSLVKDIKVIDYDFEKNGVDKSKVKEFGFDMSYKIEIKSVSFEVIGIKRLKYKDKERIYQAPSNDIFPHSPLTPSLAANIMCAKFELGVPLNRYSNYFINNGLNISTYDFSNYLTRTVKVLRPLYEEMIKYLMTNPSNTIHCDETPIEVLESEKDKCYMFCYRTSTWDNPVVIFEFNESRKAEKPKNWIKQYDFKGYFIVDGYSAYDEFASMGVKIQRCMVHLRRYYVDCLKPLKQEDRPKNAAYKVVEILKEIFHLEAEFKNKKYTAEKIKEERNSKDYIKHLKELDEYIFKIEYKGDDSLLGKAVTYYKNQRKEFYTFLKDGHVEIDNNIAERAIRPFTIVRRAFLFCKTCNGADTTAQAYSIVQTARANGLIPEKYIKYVLENISKKDISELLPWSESLPNEVKISFDNDTK